MSYVNTINALMAVTVLVICISNPIIRSRCKVSPSISRDVMTATAMAGLSMVTATKMIVKSIVKLSEGAEFTEEVYIIFASVFVFITGLENYRKNTWPPK